MKWLRRMVLVTTLLSAAAVAGWRLAKIRAYPMGAGEWLDAPDGKHYAALYQIIHRPFTGGFRQEWRIEVGAGTAVQPAPILFSEVIPASALPDPLSAETAMRWDSAQQVTFTLKSGERRFTIPETTRP
jgi:hypothetical protein